MQCNCDVWLKNRGRQSLSLSQIGIYIAPLTKLDSSAKHIKKFLVNAKQSFYSPVNGILGKVLNFASEDVILQLIVSKSMPILLYGLDACPVNKTDLRSLDFTVNRVLMKLFKTGNIEIVRKCQAFFGQVYQTVRCF